MSAGKQAPVLPGESKGLLLLPCSIISFSQNLGGGRCRAGAAPQGHGKGQQGDWCCLPYTSPCNTGRCGYNLTSPALLPGCFKDQFSQNTGSCIIIVMITHKYLLIVWGCCRENSLFNKSKRMEKHQWAIPTQKAQSRGQTSNLQPLKDRP